MVVIVDYGMGNLGSIQNMLKKNGYASLITSNSKEIEQADHLILPGVGAFDTGMKRLEELNLIPVLNHKALIDRVPVLGICLGIQLMSSASEEGQSKGLNWFNAETIRFDLSNQIEKHPLPHMGWRQVVIKKDVPLYEGLDDAWFYFVHNYHIVAPDSDEVGMTTEYGYEFVASLAKNNLLGVQFHPEKSHKYGLRLLSNFIKYY